MNKRVFTQTYGVAGALLEKDGKILLIKENAPKYPEAHGKWNQPAGWVDVGEDPITACERETKEETGLDFKAKQFLGIYSLHKKFADKSIGGSGHKHGIKLIFTGDFTGKLMEPNDEISELRWFTPEEIYQMEFDTLRDMDIKQEIKDYLAGKGYPLEIVKHTVME